MLRKYEKKREAYRTCLVLSTSASTFQAVNHSHVHETEQDILSYMISMLLCVFVMVVVVINKRSTDCGQESYYFPCATEYDKFNVTNSVYLTAGHRSRKWNTEDKIKKQINFALFLTTSQLVFHGICMRISSID